MNSKFSLSFFAREIFGSLGDLPLFFVFFVGLSQVSHLNPLNILFWSGLVHMVVGVVFKIPLSLQPMKAMGLYAIAHGLSAQELLTAGMGLGLFILVINAFGLFQKLYDHFPPAVIRGIYLGLALSLFQKAYGLIFLEQAHSVAALGAMSQGGQSFALTFFSPHWTKEVFTLMLIQLPLTTANSIFSPALLIKDYFPHRVVKASHIAASVGLINLLTCPFGGMPACHGSGGIAAQYRLGARTGISIIFLGLLKIIAAVWAGSLFFKIAYFSPKVLLGILLLLPAFELSYRAFSIRNFLNVSVVIVTALVSVLWHAGWGMGIGCLLFFSLNTLEKREHKEYVHG